LDLLAYKVYRSWLKIRKNSVIVHWLFGVLCAVVAVLWFPASVILLLLFAMDEVWNDHDGIKNGITTKYSGCEDWWDAFLVFCFGLSIDVILNLAKVIEINWY
jgi:hypothetical protein